ncbi:beta-1,3-galactosyl-O-glycosyl-glycoprotein beta-1,6-N-acetylglucosaminyltransferase 4 isoform 5-T6 [Syngnathus typhle]
MGDFSCWFASQCAVTPTDIYQGLYRKSLDHSLQDRARMKVRCGCSIFRVRHRYFLFLLSLVAVCLLKLVYLKVTVWESTYIDPHGITGKLSGIHSHMYDVNCTAIYELDPVEIGKALELKQKVLVAVDDESTPDHPGRGILPSVVSSQDFSFPVVGVLSVSLPSWEFKIRGCLRIFVVFHTS